MKRFMPKDFEQFSGTIEYKHFQAANHLVVCEQEDESAWDPGLSSHNILHCWLTFIDWALQDSWLVKDNCFVCEIAYCKLSGDRFSGWSNNSLYAQASTADGDRQAVVTFDESELKLWEARSLKLRNQLHETGYSIFTPVISKETTRFARFLNFVQIARRTTHPAMKIAQMCSALESLFSTTQTELTHRLSERVAFFLGGTPEEMEGTYQFMKKAYGVRSQVTHGSHISKAVADATPELSKNMLGLLRKITFRILDSDDAASLVNGTPEFIEEHFRKCLFFGIQ